MSLINCILGHPLQVLVVLEVDTEGIKDILRGDQEAKVEISTPEAGMINICDIW